MTDKKFPFPDPLTIKLKAPALIHQHNYGVNDVVTLNKDRAMELVEAGKAVVVPLDRTKIPDDSPRSRPYRTATVAPARNAATLTGKAK